MGLWSAAAVCDLGVLAGRPQDGAGARRAFRERAEALRRWLDKAPWPSAVLFVGSDVRWDDQWGAWRAAAHVGLGDVSARTREDAERVLGDRALAVDGFARERWGGSCPFDPDADVHPSCGNPWVVPMGTGPAGVFAHLADAPVPGGCGAALAVVPLNEADRDGIRPDQAAWIQQTPGVLGGRPRIRGTRVAVALALDWVRCEGRAGAARRLVDCVPSLGLDAARSAVDAALAFAAAVLDRPLGGPPPMPIA